MSVQDWFATNHTAVGTWAGVAISAAGFLVTIVMIRRSKSAAIEARDAAQAATRKIQLLRNVQIFAETLASLEDVKRLHRIGEWDTLLDRYGPMRKQLVWIRGTHASLSTTDRALIQQTITTLSGIEREVEEAVATGSTPDATRLNTLLATRLDELHDLLARLSQQPS